jgi:predicted AAA+ superfamily ATPase
VQIKTSDSYVPRLADARFLRLLNVTGAVTVDGPKWCGKTWLARTQARSKVLLQDPAGNYRNRRMALEDPTALLSRDKPRLIDEWQDAPGVWDAVRIQVAGVLATFRRERGRTGAPVRRESDALVRFSVGRYTS